mgnify:CR=1 FL=1
MRPRGPRGLSLCLSLLLSLAVPTAGRAAPDAAVDHVAIASRLVGDGLWERAAAVLDEVDAPTDAQAVRYHTLRGLVALRLGDAEGALRSLDAAVATGEAEPLVQVYRAQALHGLQRPSQALAALDTAGEHAEGLAGAWQLRARCHRELDQPDRAYDALQRGHLRFPDHRGLVEDKLLMLVQLGLTRQVLDEGTALLHRLDASEDLWVAIGDRLRAAGALDEAMAWLEEARLRFPDTVRSRVALAGACLDGGRPRCAGAMLQEAAAFDPAYASEAAECFRRAGDLDRALFLNGQVPDPATKVRQRLGLLLEQGRFEQAAALDPRLRRLSLLASDQELAYALAYAHLKAGHPERAEALLRTLTEPHLFQQATALRESMATCEATGRGCD